MAERHSSTTPLKNLRQSKSHASRLLMQAVQQRSHSTLCLYVL